MASLRKGQTKQITMKYVIILLLLASCATSKTKQTTTTDIVQVVTKDSTEEKANVVKVETKEEVSDEETFIVEKETTFDSLGKVVNIKEKVTAKKKAIQIKEAKASDSSGVKVTKQSVDSVVVKKTENIKSKASFSFPLWWLLILFILAFVLYKRYINRFLL
jgi:cobalamin biosynthesis Mg chelatase CobN